MEQHASTNSIMRLHVMALFRQGGGAVTRPPAERLHSGSNPDLGFDVAAIAAGKLPFPSRTRKISLSTFYTVLKCESLWEL
jgi:hypothetical protein